MHVDPPSCCSPNPIYSKKKKNKKMTGSFYNTLHCGRYSRGSECEKVKNNNLISSYSSEKRGAKRGREQLVRALHGE